MKSKPQKIVILYLLISIAWILLSDYLVQSVSALLNVEVDILQSGKGVFFVLVTAFLLYVSIRKQQKFLISYGEQYKNLFHSNPNPLWIYDRNTLKFLEVNNAAIRIYGYSKDEFKKMTILDIRPTEDRQSTRESANSMPDGYHISGTWKHLKKSGKILTVAVTSHKIKFNKRECAMVMAQDITLRLQQEERLKLSLKIEKELKEELEKNIERVKQSLESTQRLAEVVDRIHNMVMITDPMQKIQWVNQAFVNFTGYCLDEVVGREPDFLHGPKTDQETLSRFIEALQRNDFGTFEILNYTKTGQEYWIDLSISAIYNDKNEVVRYISIQNIVTERKIREQKIKEQNEILRKHSWTNSHAIRKPVASILSLLLLSKETTEMEEIKEIHSLIEASSEELDTILKTIGKEINASEMELLEGAGL